MKEKLNEYRNRIEALSHEIKEHSLAVVDEKRELALLSRLQARTNLPKALVKDLFEVIIKHSRNIQR